MKGLLAGTTNTDANLNRSNRQLKKRNPSFTLCESLSDGGELTAFATLSSVCVTPSGSWSVASGETLAPIRTDFERVTLIVPARSASRFTQVRVTTVP